MSEARTYSYSVSVFQDHDGTSRWSIAFEIQCKQLLRGDGLRWLDNKLSKGPAHAHIDLINSVAHPANSTDDFLRLNFPMQSAVSLPLCLCVAEQADTGMYDR